MNTTSAMQVTITKQQHRFASWMADVLIYIVVLNLFVEFNDAIVIESFWISILTAVLLQALIAALKDVEHHVGSFFAKRDGTLPRAAGLVAKFLILFTSKLIILEIVNFVFGDEVELGHFVDVLFLILAMMVARWAVGKIYVSLGKVDTEEA